MDGINSGSRGPISCLVSGAPICPCLPFVECTTNLRARQGLLGDRRFPTDSKLHPPCFLAKIQLKFLAASNTIKIYEVVTALIGIVELSHIDFTSSNLMLQQCR